MTNVQSLARTYITDEGPLFEERYNRAPFMFDHSLHELDIFDIPNLAEVSKRLSAYYSNDSADIGDGWGSDAAKRPSLSETIATIAETNSLVLMKGLAEDPEFAPVFDRVLEEIYDRVGSALTGDVTVSRATLIISSPNRVTPYHIDAETNFLFQLRGDKIVNVFNPNDRTLLTDLELERFYAGDMSAATYQIDRQKDATVFDFAPGKGAHIPILSPHWVQNGDSVSVAISINCSLGTNKRLAHLYKVNNFIRKSGLVPAPPGASAWQDRLKLAAVDGMNYVRRGGPFGRKIAKP